MIFAVHIVLAVVACAALWWLARNITRAATPPATLIVSLGLALRALVGQALFWISWLNLPILRSLHSGEGYWFFAIDSPGYMTYAKLIAEGHPAAAYPSRTFVHALSAFVYALGFFTSVGLLLNCATYLATCALILFIARGAKTPALVALAAISFAPGAVLWACQPLKDSLFMFAFAAMVGACLVWQEAASVGQRVAAAATLLLFLYVLAGMRWYFAVFLWGCWAIFALWVALIARRKVWMLLGSAAMLALFVPCIRAGAVHDLPEIPNFRHPDEPVAKLERTRRGFESVRGATTITPGRKLPQQVAVATPAPALPSPAPAPAPAPAPTPAPVPVPAPVPAPAPVPVPKAQPQPQAPRPAPVPQPIPPPKPAPVPVPVPAPAPAPAPVPVPVPKVQPPPPPKPVPPSSPPSTARRVVATAMVTFLPRTLVELLGLAHIEGGRGLWLFVDADTLAFDAVLVFAFVYIVRSGRRITPLAVALVLLFFLVCVPVVYVVNNFGTLFRLREMLYLIAVFLPLTLGPPRR